MKIKKGDTVIVTTGKSRGVIAKITKAMPKEEKVIVEGANLRAVWKKDPNGASVQAFEAAPIHVSNVAIADPKTGKATRILIQNKDGKRVRVAKKSGTTIA